jgi:hypothetical protein
MQNDKAAALTDSIVKGMETALSKNFTTIGNALATLQQSLSVIDARLEALEGGVTGAVTAKRAIRGASAGAGKKEAAIGGKKQPKVTNALLYLRHTAALDIDGARAQLFSEDRLAQIDADETMAKKKLAEDEPTYYSAAADFLWKNILSEEDKKGIRQQFNAWKETTERNENPNPLEEDLATE